MLVLSIWIEEKTIDNQKNEKLMSTQNDKMPLLAKIIIGVLGLLTLLLLLWLPYYYGKLVQAKEGEKTIEELRAQNNDLALRLATPTNSPATPHAATVPSTSNPAPATTSTLPADTGTDATATTTYNPIATAPVTATPATNTPTARNIHPTTLLGINLEGGNGNQVNGATIIVNSPGATVTTGNTAGRHATVKNQWPEGSQPECILIDINSEEEIQGSFVLSGNKDVLIDVRSMNGFIFTPVVSGHDLDFIEIAYNGIRYHAGMRLGKTETFQIRLKPNTAPWTTVPVSYKLKKH